MITSISKFKYIVEALNINDIQAINYKIKSIVDSPLWNTIITQLNEDDVDYMNWSDIDIILYYSQNYDSEILESNINEDLQDINSDKEVKLKNYQDQMAKYNANKGKFMSILLTKKQEQWEQAANLIIAGNIYLGLKWKLDKMEHQIKQDEERLKSTEITKEEKADIQKNVLENKKKFAEQKKEMDLKIRQDLQKIQTL
ncbi:MAG: hypothetical protein E6R13_03775 [Spirochaetes bacterium]|nr:MAG: hypothetical protein E6R13_03775 [Spirochaetota bacterium]